LQLKKLHRTVLHMDNRVGASGWEDVTRLLSGIVSDDERHHIILNLAETNIFLAAKCCASSFDQDPAERQAILKKAQEMLEQDTAKNSNAPFMSLIELGEVPKAIGHMRNLRFPTDRHTEVIREILAFDDGKYAVECVGMLREDGKNQRRLVLFGLKALGSSLLESDALRREIEALGRQLVSEYQYTELKSLVRKPGFVIAHCIDGTIEDFIYQLIHDNSHLSHKHKRLDLAIELIKKLELSRTFPVSEIIETVLDDNEVAALPNRNQLLGVIWGALNSSSDPTTVKDYVDRLLKSPGHESVECALDLIDRFQLVDSYDLVALIRDSTSRRVWGKMPERLKEAIEWLELQEDFPGYELLGQTVTGTVTKVTPSRVFLSTELPYSCSLYIREVARKINRVDDVCKVGDTLRAKIVNLSDRGLELSVRALDSRSKERKSNRGQQHDSGT
jgi:S1 RNA binding domain